MAIEEDEVLLTVAQVAKWLSLHEASVRKLLTEGRLVGLQPVQREWRISREDVIAFIEQGKQRSVGRPKKQVAEKVSAENASIQEK